MKRVNKKTLLLIASAICIACVLSMFIGCWDSYSPNKKEYWFEDYSAIFLKYDETADNLDEAGNYWEMTVKNDCKITIAIAINTDYYSTLYFYVNGEQVKSDDPSMTIYDYVYKDLTLKKGDKLQFHAFWVNSIMANDEGFTISLFTVNDGTGSGDYIIENL